MKYYDITVSLPDKCCSVEADSEQEAIDIMKNLVLGDPYFVLDGGKVSPNAEVSYSPATMLTAHEPCPVFVEDAHSWVAACGTSGRDWLEKMEVMVTDCYEVD